MANIQVPIGRGLLQQPQQQKEQFTKSLSDREFLKQLADEGRLVGSTASDIITTTADLIINSIVPPNGSTFYFISGSWVNSMGAPRVTLELRLDGVAIEGYTNSLTSTMLKGDWLTDFSMKGDGTKAITVVAIESAAGAGSFVSSNICGYFQNTVSSRDST